MKILIAEDELLLLKTIELRLIKEGHKVVLASDGKQAIHLVETEKPDLLISDIMMPFCSGLELISHVRQNLGLNIPIIILSATGLETTIVQAFKLGADDYITKPFNPSELIARVNRMEIRLNAKY